MNKYFLPILLLPLLLAACKDNSENASPAFSAGEVAYENPDWAKELITAYENFHEDRNVRSATMVFNASEKMPVKNWENYLVSALVFAEAGVHNKSFQAIDKAVAYGLKDTSLLNSLPQFEPLKNSRKWHLIIAEAARKSEAYRSGIKNPELLQELELLWAKDQEALSEYERKMSALEESTKVDAHKNLFKEVEDRWEVNKNKLDSIINIHGWPNNSLVGEDGAKIAWSIAQHHPDVFFKQKCLRLIEKEVRNGTLDPNHFAELSDRIARDTWQKQTYGASMGAEEPHPIRDVAEVNKRRLELGLAEPIEVYALYHGISYNIPSDAEMEDRYQEAQSAYQRFKSHFRTGRIASSMIHLREALDVHGDISNQQLFEAARKLARTGNTEAEDFSLEILQVLIWRKWEGRSEIPGHPDFKSISEREDWKALLSALDKSEN